MSDVAVVRHPTPGLAMTLDVAAKALLVMLLGLAITYPELGNMQEKAAGLRAVALGVRRDGDVPPAAVAVRDAPPGVGRGDKEVVEPGDRERPPHVLLGRDALTGRGIGSPGRRNPQEPHGGCR